MLFVIWKPSGSPSTPLNAFVTCTLPTFRLYAFTNAAAAVFPSSVTFATAFVAFSSLVAFPLIVRLYPSASYPLSVKVTSVPTGTSSITHVYGSFAFPVPLVLFPTVNTVSLKLFLIWKPSGSPSTPLNAFVTCTLPTFRLYAFTNAAAAVFPSSVTFATAFVAFSSLVAFPLIVRLYPSASYPLSVKVTSVPTGTSSITHVYGSFAFPVPLVLFPTVNTVSLKLFLIWKPSGSFSKPLNAFVTCTLPLAGFSVFAT